MSDFIFKVSPNIVLGSYTLSRLGHFVKKWGTRFIVVIDPVLTEFGITEKITSSFQERNVDYFVYDEIPPASDTTIIQQVNKIAKDAHVHGIISVGGTKTANIARAVAALFHEEHDIYDYLEGQQPTSASLPLICIPTTFCDAFLFCDQTPVIDARSRVTKLLKMQPGVCKLTAFDPTLTVSLTENQHSAMTLHLLCTAIEAYTSQKANFFSDGIIEKACSLLKFLPDDNLPDANTPSAGLLSAQASCMIALGAATSSVGIGSIINLAVNARHKISRSLVSAILLPYIIEEVSAYKTERLANISRLLHVATAEASDEDAVSSLCESVRNKIAIAHLPARLKDLSLSPEELALCAEDAGQLDYAHTLPRSMTADDLFSVIQKAF